MSRFKFRRSISMILVVLLLMTTFDTFQIQPVLGASSGDAYVNYDSGTGKWTMGTGMVESIVQFSGGNFSLISYKNKLTNREYVQGGATDSEEFSIQVDSTEYKGNSGVWVYDSYNTSTLSQGELQLNITFHNNVVKVTRHYIVYPSTGIIQEWSDFQNVSGATRNFTNPHIFLKRLMQNDMSSLDFNYMTGGSWFTGSHVLKTVAVSSSYSRTFDSVLDPVEVMTVDGHTNGNSCGNIGATNKYQEFFALRNRTNNDGIFVTFDYMGKWIAETGLVDAKSFTLENYAFITNLSVANNETITAPKSAIGVFKGDMDDMGNTILDYQYRYKWDYTRDKYVGQVNMVQWKQTPHEPNAYAAINNAGYLGAGMMWLDSGVFGDSGTWITNDDIAGINSYAKKHDMTMAVWMPVWHGEQTSTVLVNNPSWQVANDYKPNGYGMHLNQSLPAVYNWELNLLNSTQTAFGSHMWRYDGDICFDGNGGTNSVLLGQSNNFYALTKAFKDANPDAGIFNCSSGGAAISIENTRYAELVQPTDGDSYHYDGYYLSMLVPPDKIDANTAYDTVSWPNYEPEGRGKLSYNFNIDCYSNAETPMSDADKESLRKDIDLHSYFMKIGVSGRYSKVYRPTISAGDQTYFLQKTNSDNSKAFITVRRGSNAFATNFTLYPKGLNATTNYTMQTLCGSATAAAKTGAQWMSGGIPVTNLAKGEIFFFNLQNRPNAITDTVVPTAPTNVTGTPATYLSHGGNEVSWTAGTDNNWISYYNLYKNGNYFSKVSRGTFFFDDTGVAGDTYGIQTVDGDGNVSAIVTTAGIPLGAFPAPNANYKIVNRKSGKVAAVMYGSTYSGATLIQWPFGSSSLDQQWKFVSARDGYYKIINRKSGLYLVLQAGSVNDGTLFCQWTYSNDYLDQQWQISDVGSGYYKIVNRKSGKVIAVRDGSIVDGADLIQWSYGGATDQQWQILAP